MLDGRAEQNIPLVADTKSYRKVPRYLNYYHVHKLHPNWIPLELIQSNPSRNWRWSNRYHNTSSITDMLQDLNLETLESRRTTLQLVMIYKIINGLVTYLLTPIWHQRQPELGTPFEEVATVSRKDRYLQVQLLPKDHTCVEFTTSLSYRSLWLGTLQAGVVYSHILSYVGASVQVGSEGFWSCAGWATISSGSYCSRIGLITQWRFENAGWKLSFFFIVYPLYFSLSYFSYFFFFSTAARGIVFKLEWSLLTYRNRNFKWDTGIPFAVGVLFK